MRAARAESSLRVRSHAAHVLHFSVAREEAPHAQLRLRTMLLVQLAFVNNVVMRKAKLIEYLSNLLAMQLLAHQLVDLLLIVNLLQGHI